jgi:hypothetical protein
MGSGLKSKKKNAWMPIYLPTENEMKWRDFCVKENIRISPLGIKDEKKKWRIGIALGPYKKGEKMHIAPSVYDEDTIWIEYYRMCKYYYDKYRK